MKLVTRFFLILIIGGFYFACSSNTEPSPNVNVSVTDINGQALSLYGLQLIDANDGWLGTPYKSILGGKDDPASLYH